MFRSSPIPESDRDPSHPYVTLFTPPPIFSLKNISFLKGFFFLWLIGSNKNMLLNKSKKISKYKIY